MKAGKPDESQRWFYTIEIDRGVFTEGQGHQNIAITRDLLRSVDFKGRDCIDIGTQEALVPILLKRGGAKRVVGYDRRNLSERIACVQTVHGAAFDYVGGVQLRDLPAVLDGRGGRYFDLVVFSAVLTQLADPLGGLALVRSFCKIGGLFLIETETIFADEYHLVFNAKGSLDPYSHFFTPTTAWLDYALRLLGLRPVDVRYLGKAKRLAKLRVAVLCSSEPAACPLDPADQWAFLPSHERNFKESQLDWAELKKQISAIEQGEVRHPPTAGINASIRRSRPHPLEQDDLRLLLTSSM